MKNENIRLEILMSSLLNVSSSSHGQIDKSTVCSPRYHAILSKTFFCIVTNKRVLRGDRVRWVTICVNKFVTKELNLTGESSQIQNNLKKKNECL